MTPIPDDHSATHGVIGLVRGYWTDLQERAVGIDYVGYPLAYWEFLARTKPCHAGWAAPGFDFIKQLGDDVELFAHVSLVLNELRIVCVQRRAKRRRQGYA